MQSDLLALVSGSTPFVAVVVMALLVAINPCPLATVVSSLLFLTGRQTSRRQGWWIATLYALGRALLYFSLGLLSAWLLRTSIQTLQIQEQILYGLEHWLGPLIILLGVLLWLFGRHDHHDHHNHQDEEPTHQGEEHDLEQRQPLERQGAWSWRVLWLGFSSALFFCPATGLIYFGMLVPMTAQAGGAVGLLYLGLFALLTASVAYPVYGLIRMGLSRLERFAGGMQRWRKWLNVGISLLFVVLGIVMTLVHLLHGHESATLVGSL
ncbi:sulfite exporter TauE/SafE family protein [uncultured Porphyromonas sp.]|uniref:urease accessory protein UreH domain-containing protein n=1 Tax=uncultured Porphyromonas sp. TaxID=159274 RepID=UPI002620A039|nr:sulfite exporter TauE/SafE family protein [uncultured Porphyromonas sp.]